MLVIDRLGAAAPFVQPTRPSTTPESQLSAEHHFLALAGSVGSKKAIDPWSHHSRALTRAVSLHPHAEEASVGRRRPLLAGIGRTSLMMQGEDWPQSLLPHNALVQQLPLRWKMNEVNAITIKVGLRCTLGCDRIVR